MNLRFENLKRRYGDKTVLDFEQGWITDGTITGLIGPNGAGKTTFLNIVAGLDKPSEGCVTYGYTAENGDPLFTETVPKEKVTLLFQHPYLIHTTVEKNLAYPLKLRKIPKAQIDTRVAELMHEMGLTSLAKQRGRRISGGEMQKVAFARALSFYPELLLMDEATSNLDSATTAEVERIIRRENREKGTTIVIVSHNLAQIKRLCDEVIFIDEGRIIESGSVFGVFDNPQKAETKAFFEDRLLNT